MICRIIWLLKTKFPTATSPRLTMTEITPFLRGLSPVGGKDLLARFDGGRMSSDGGVLVLREIEVYRRGSRLCNRREIATRKEGTIMTTNIIEDVC